jgi:hypothetical protein
VDERIVTVVNLRLQKAAFAGQVNKFGVNLGYAIIQHRHFAAFFTGILIGELAARRVIIAMYVRAPAILAGDTHIGLELELEACLRSETRVNNANLER